MYDILTFGASIDELNTEAIQQAIDAAASAGGGTVVVPAGEFLTGALFLKSNVELHLSAGAVLKFSDDPKVILLFIHVGKESIEKSMLPVSMHKM